MKTMLASGILGLSLFAASANAQIRLRSEGEVQNRINVDIPTTGIEAATVQSLIDTVAGFIVEGKSEVVLADALANVTVPAEFQALVDKVVASRSPTAQVECLGRLCKIVSLGTALDFKVDGVTLPVIGTPSISLTKEINIYTAISEDHQRAEICRITGISVKAGFLKLPVDGALLELEDGAVKTLRVDAGTGGDYPTTACDFVSPPAL